MDPRGLRHTAARRPLDHVIQQRRLAHTRFAAHHQRQALARANSFDERFDVVRGHDPDRLPLTFVAGDTGWEMSLDDYHHAMATMYSVDL